MRRKYYAVRPGPDLRGDDIRIADDRGRHEGQEAAAANCCNGARGIHAVDRGGILKPRDYPWTRQIATGKHVYNRGLQITARTCSGGGGQIQTFPAGGMEF